MDNQIQAQNEKPESDFSKFFKIRERGSNIKTEIMAGLTTFFAMAYIVVTNPNQITGFNQAGQYGTIWNAVYVASVLVAVVGTLLYALYANMPFAQACGMGLNSFFFTSFILPNVADPFNGYRSGLCVILLSGVIFIVLSVTGARKHIARALPECLKKAIPAGIGLFIALLGFKNAGIVVGNQYTLVSLFDFHGAIKSAANGYEAWKVIAPVVISLLALCAIAVLEKFRVKGSVILTILGSTIVYYIAIWDVPSFDMGQVVQSFKDFGHIGLLGAFKGFDDLFAGGASAIINAIVLIITFCLVDMFDTIGTLYGTASQADMLDENGDPLEMDKSMQSDAIATLTGAVLGTSTCTTFVESASGVAAGGRTGLTSLVTAACFFVCLFLSPVAAIVPACATAPALIYVGVLMLKGFAKVDMSDISEAVPSFLALIMMPLTYSISNGIAMGAISYAIIRLCTGKYTKKDIIVTVIGVLFVLRFFLVTM